jgi:hypothetical protein
MAAEAIAEALGITVGYARAAVGGLFGGGEEPPTVAFTLDEVDKHVVKFHK